MPRLSLDEIETLAADRLRDAGASPLQAAPVARSVRRAEADGIGLVGLGYLPTYLGHLRSGKVDGNAIPAVSTPRAATVLVDAAHGFAHPAFDPDAFAVGFLDRIADLAAAMLAQPGVRLPGDRRLAARAAAETQGVEISDAQFALLHGRSP